MVVFGHKCELTGNVLTIEENTLLLTDIEIIKARENFFDFCNEKINDIYEETF